jgi:hypothetical protein
MDVPWNRPPTTPEECSDRLCGRRAERISPRKASVASPGPPRFSAHWQTVLEATFCPQRVQPALNLERRTLANIAFKALAVIADIFYDAVRPSIGKSERLTELPFDAEQPPDFRVWRF